MLMLLLYLSLFITSSSAADQTLNGDKLKALRDLKIHDNRDTKEIYGKIKFNYNHFNEMKDPFMLGYTQLINIPTYEISYNNVSSRKISFETLEEITDVIVQDDPVHYNKLVLDKVRSFTCNLFECHVGLVFNRKNAVTKDIIENKVTDFEHIYYQKVVTNNGFLSFDIIDVNDVYYPLVLCPTQNWINKFTDAKFVPRQYNDIFNISTPTRYTLTPMFPRNPYSNNFVCGDLYYYKNKTALRIGYKMSIKTTSGGKPKMEFEGVNLLKDQLGCPKDQNEYNYHHFVYETDNNNIATMNYVDLANPGNNGIYHNSKVFMYHKFDGTKIDNAKKMILNWIQNWNHQSPYPSIEPACIKKIKPINGIIKLYNKNGKEVVFTSNGKNRKTKVIYVNKENMKEINDYECRVVPRDINKKYLKNFYSHTFDSKIVSIDNNDVEKVIEKFQFNNSFSGFGNYSCKLFPKYGEILHEDKHLIDGLTFEIVPSNELNLFKEKVWKNNIDAIVHCDKTTFNFAKFVDMSVTLSEKSKYKNSVDKEKYMFMDENNYIRFKINDYIREGKTFKDITYYCSYETYGKTIFKINKKASILNPNFINTSDSNEVYTKYTAILISLSVILIILFVVALISTVIIMKRIKKIRKLEKKNGLENLSSMSSSLSKSDSASSLPSKSGSKSGTPLSKSTSSTANSKITKQTFESRPRNFKFVTK